LSTEGDTSSHAVAAAIHGTYSIRLSHLYPPPAVGPGGRVRCPPQLPLVSKSPAYALHAVRRCTRLYSNPCNIYLEHLCPPAVQILSSIRRTLLRPSHLDIRLRHPLSAFSKLLPKQARAGAAPPDTVGRRHGERAFRGGFGLLLRRRPITEPRRGSPASLPPDDREPVTGEAAVARACSLTEAKPPSPPAAKSLDSVIPCEPDVWAASASVAPVVVADPPSCLPTTSSS